MKTTLRFYQPEATLSSKTEIGVPGPGFQRPDSMDVDLDLVRLNLVKGMTPRAAAVLREAFGDVAAAFAAPAAELAALPDIGPKLAARVAKPPRDAAVRKEVRRAEGLGARIFHPGAAGYPERLREIGFGEIVPSHGGARIAGRLCDLLPEENRPVTLSEIDEYLKLVIRAVVDLPAPIETDPMITAVKPGE